MAGHERVISVPGDKSLSHRALILAALADGDSRIRGMLAAADTESTAMVLRELGCAVSSLHGDETLVRGVGLRGLLAPRNALDCGNSGTTARLMLGVLAGYPFRAVLTGDASLRSRPMRRVTEPLARMGARFDELDTPDHLPIAVEGGELRGLHYESPLPSAQVKSAILLAGITGGVDATVVEPQASRDHTERMLAHLGVKVEYTSDGGINGVRMTPPSHIGAFEFDVPGDASSAAFVVALSLLAAREPVRIRNVGLNPGRTGFIDVARRMGGRIHVVDTCESFGDVVGDVVVERSSLHAVRVGGAEIPSLIDEVPVLAMLAARANGTTVIDGAAELRVKESDRIAAVVHNLRAIGVHADELDDGMTVQGTDAPLAGDVQVRHDHRIAMCFGVLAAVPGNDVRIDDPAAADVSFPGFSNVLREVTA